MSSSDEETRAKPAKRPFWRKKRWWLFGMLGIFVLGLVWLDGPGWRWIAKKAAGHYLSKFGYEASFELGGRLTSGSIRVTDLELESGTVVQLAGLESLSVEYRLRRVIKGEIESVRLTGLDARIDLAAEMPSAVEEEAPGPEEAEDPEKPAPAPKELLADIRERLIPMNIELADSSITVVRGDELVYRIESTTISHDAGSSDFTLDLGAMEFAGGRSLEAQRANIRWTRERLELDAFRLLPDLAVRELAVVTPEDDPLRFSTGVLLAGSRFEVATDLETASLEMADTPLALAEVGEVFGFEMPVTGTVSALDLQATDLRGGLGTIDAELALTSPDVRYDHWQFRDARLDLALDDDRATGELDATVSGSPATLEVSAVLDRANNFIPTEAEATLTSPAVKEVLTHVRARYLTPEPPDETDSGETGEPQPRPDIPVAALEVTARSDFDERSIPTDASASLSLTSSEDAPPIRLDARWRDEVAIVENFEVPGLTLSGDFTPAGLTYRGELATESFMPDSLGPWLAPFGISVPEGLLASLDWKGSGDLEANTHQGELDLPLFSWNRPGEPEPIEASADAVYDWPESVNLRALEVETAGQTVAAALTLEERVLNLREASWSDGDEILTTGRASIPLPEDLTDWRALLRETRPVELHLETPELKLAKLHPFLPETTRFSDASSGRVVIDLTGTPTDPMLDAAVTGSDIALASQPKVPPADFDLKAVGSEQTLKIDGDIRLPDYPPAKISGVTSWDPRQWAENPVTVRKAKLDGSLSISDLNLTAFTRFMPETEELGGVVNAEVELGGTIGEPEPRARVTLDGGRFAMRRSSIPPVRGGTLEITATPEAVTLDNLRAEIAGGTLSGRGDATLVDGAPGELDITLTGNALPVLRDESMIVRANADLAVTGPWESARLSGSVGVIDSLYFRDFELLPMGLPNNQVSKPSLPRVDAASPQESVSSIPEPFRGWGLDLTLKTANPFLIRGNLASGEVYLDATVGGTIGAPRPDGEAILREVTAALPFSTLEIRRGIVKFRPNVPFDPLLDIRGESTIRPYEVTLYITGPVSDPRIQPTSNPPLPRSEVLTLLATGTTTKGLEDPQAAAARAMQLFIEEMRRGRIGAVSWMRPVFRVLDNVQFQVGESDPYTSKQYNSATIEFDDHWQLNAGISEEGNTRAKVIYLFRFR